MTSHDAASDSLNITGTASQQDGDSNDVHDSGMSQEQFGDVTVRTSDDRNSNSDCDDDDDNRNVASTLGNTNANDPNAAKTAAKGDTSQEYDPFEPTDETSDVEYDAPVMNERVHVVDNDAATATSAAADEYDPCEPTEDSCGQADVVLPAADSGSGDHHVTTSFDETNAVDERVNDAAAAADSDQAMASPRVSGDDDDDAVPIVDVPSFDSIEEPAGDTMQTDELSNSNSNTDTNVAECDDALADSVMPQDEQSARDVDESLVPSHREDDSALVTTEALTAADILVEDDAEPLSHEERDVTVAPPPPAVTSESPALVSTAGQAHEGGALPSVLSLK